MYVYAHVYTYVYVYLYPISTSQLQLTKAFKRSKYLVRNAIMRMTESRLSQAWVTWRTKVVIRNPRPGPPALALLIAHMLAHMLAHC